MKLESVAGGLTGCGRYGCSGDGGQQRSSSEGQEHRGRQATPERHTPRRQRQEHRRPGQTERQDQEEVVHGTRVKGRDQGVRSTPIFLFYLFYVTKTLEFYFRQCTHRKHRLCWHEFQLVLNQIKNIKSFIKIEFVLCRQRLAPAAQPPSASGRVAGRGRCGLGGRGVVRGRGSSGRGGTPTRRRSDSWPRSTRRTEVQLPAAPCADPTGNSGAVA